MRVFGPEHSDVATALNDLGIVFRRQGDNRAARNVLEQALRIHERIECAERGDRYGLGNLGDILSDQGELRPARALLQRSLYLNEMIFGADHPMVAAPFSSWPGY